jgi:diguanylate cyclase (GGDEF)-like protein
VPNGLLFIAVAVVVQLELLTQYVDLVAKTYPYFIAAVGILLGWRFHRSRLVFSLLILALAYIALHRFVPVAPDSNPFGPESNPGADLPRTVYRTVAFLLPLNLAVFSLLKERGVLTWRGMLRLGFILVQPLALVLAFQYPELNLAHYLDDTVFPLSIPAHIPLLQPALLAFAAAFLVVTLRFGLYRDPIDSGFFWALVSTCFALVLHGNGNFSEIYFGTAGLVLTISVIETSYGMAFRDELTGLPARRALNETLVKLGSTYTVAMLDIDFFKKFNDRYGHDVGDQVLRMVACQFAKVAGGGKPFRYGGEEFTVVFPGKLVDETMPYLERLRKGVEASGFVVRSRKRPRKKPEKPKKSKRPQTKVKVTISIGVAERNEKQTSPQQVIKAADKALYRAKKKGRNRIST